MGTNKVTFTLDTETIHQLNDAAERLAKPKSEIVREAIHDLHERIGMLSERERIRLLSVFDEMLPLVPERPQAEVNSELRAIRKARKSGGRLSLAAKAR
jgi:hypothetical protein